MNSFDAYLLRRIYKKIAKLGDKLAEADAQIDWTTFRPFSIKFPILDSGFFVIVTR